MVPISKQRSKARDKAVAKVKHNTNGNETKEVKKSNTRKKQVNREENKPSDGRKAKRKQEHAIPVKSGSDKTQVDSKGPVSKKRKRKAAPQSKSEESSTAKMKSVIEYLQLWDSDRDSWKFRKMSQTLALQNLYSKQLLPKKSFVICLRYMESMKGQSREKTLDEARRIVNEYEQMQSAPAEDKCNSLDTADGESGQTQDEEDKDANAAKVVLDKAARNRWKRALKVLQALS
eukprot:gb/GEZN01011122.1/.p1 GENE.gb/GEZN01011122.1/~~gb/GEZN01011122.1/.p1  ORF type:complete len:232 (-),score=50.01 gb/GEZN01011122.1/:399-1094(-)